MPTNFQQNTRFKNVPEERIDEINFVGGLVTDAHETKLKSNESPNLANVLFNDTGSIKTRNGYLRYNTDPIASSSDEANTGASTGTLTINDVADYVAQTFLVGTGASIVQCDFYLEMNTTGESQLMKAELWSSSSGPSAKLEDAQILLITQDSETEYSFRFRLPYALTATTEYAVVLRPYVAGSTQTVNTVLVHHTGAAYGSGQVYTSTDSGINWTGDATKDLKFNVYTGATAGTGLIRFYNDTGLEQTIAKVGSTLYRGNDQTGAMTTISLPSGVTIDTDAFLDWTIVNNTLLVTDGVNYIKKYRGSTNSDYTTGTISVSSGSTTVTGSGTTWNTSTNAEVGEYIKLPDGKWYKITAIASNTSLTIEVAYAGASLSGQSYVISPWGEIQGKLNSSTVPASLVRPTPNYIESHINRVWTLDGNTLRFSVLDTSVTEEHFNDWDTGSNAGQINIPAGRGDTGTGLYSLNNALYVFQRRAIWRVYGNSPANFELRNVTNEIGLINKRTLVEWNDILLFLSDSGLVMFDGSNIRNISEGVVSSSIAEWANRSTCVATLWDNKYVIAYTPSGGSQNSEALFYDLIKGVFGKFTGLYVNVWSRWVGGNDNDEVLFISSNQGSIYKWDTGSHDDGFEIETIYDTPSLGYASGINDKAIKKVYLQQIALGDWDMTVTQYSDITDTTTTGSDINLLAGDSSLWNVMLWGDDWSAQGSLITTRIAEFQGIAKFFKYRLAQTGYAQGLEVLALTVTARMRRLR